MYDETGQTNLDTKGKIKNSAYDKLCQLFLEIVTKKKDSIHELDVIGLLKNIIFSHIQKCKGSIEEGEQVRKYFKGIKKRIKYKGVGVNIFDAIIEDKIRNCSLLINQGKFDLKVFAEMERILKKFEFNYDKVKKDHYETVSFTNTFSVFGWEK